MPQQTKIFRVFVSSTFTDMTEERRILQKEVFPKLEKYCEEKGAKFQAVDLRWGVNEESQLNQKTLEICLNEIARCQRISPKPNFLILLGNRYGWQPIPAKILEDEMKQILPLLSTDDKLFIEKWYRLDENAIPGEYVLQTRDEKHKEYSVWEKVETTIKTALRNSVSKLSFTPEQKIKYFTSATHQEIINGALNPPEGTEKPEEHVFAVVRNIEGLPADNSARDYIDFVNDKPDEYCANQLANLKKELKDKLGANFNSYISKWENNKSAIANHDEFENKVYSFLKDIIERQIQEVITPDEINHEIKLHREFKERLTNYFRGREDILAKTKTYLNVQEQRVMSVIGDSGSGKSSVMAETIKRYESENKNAVVVCRFIGTTSNSSNIISLLQSICGQIAREFNITLESLAGEAKEKALYEMNGLTEILKKCLAMGTAQKPIALFLDALDQLSDADNAKSLYWIPRELSVYTKFVVSALPELEGRVSSSYIEHLPILPVPEAELILDLWLKSINRKLTSGQYNEVIEKFKNTGLAIYLKLAFEQAKQWSSYESDLSLKEDVKGIINSFIDSLEKEHTEELVKHVICYMLCGKYSGLAENEILEILVFDKEFWEGIFLPGTRPEFREELKGVTKIPIVVWSRLYLDLEPFLTERDADGVPIITFFHRQFFEVLRERYELVEVEGEVIE